MKLLGLRLCEHDSNISYFDGKVLHYFKSERKYQSKHHAYDDLNSWKKEIKELWGVDYNDLDEIATWSDYWDNPPGVSSNRPPYDSFDGDYTTFTGCEKNSTNQWIPPNGITVNNSISIWINRGSGSSVGENEIQLDGICLL